jgi:hypothetical protein
MGQNIIIIRLPLWSVKTECCFRAAKSPTENLRSGAAPSESPFRPEPSAAIPAYSERQPSDRFPGISDRAGRLGFAKLLKQAPNLRAGGQT